MPDVNFQISDILLAEYRIPSITAYNRLEPTPRTVDFDRSLKAEIRDALWMLTRQWQFGEFQGEDAATAVTTQVLGEHTVMNSVNFPGDSIFPYNSSSPLETIVEREKLVPNLFFAVQMGRYFIKLMKVPSVESFLDAFLDKYSLHYTPDKNDFEGIQLLNAVKGKIFDGFLLYNDIITPAGTGTVFTQWVNDAGLPEDKFIPLSESFKNWFQRNYSQPENTGSAWLPSNLEYQFAMSPQQQQKTLVADRYYEGHLDWYSFDINAAITSPGPEPPENNITVENLVSFIPSAVTFKGMPNPRFWMMEESQTDFGKIDTSPTGLLHLLLAEFGLICSNDWFMLPYPLSINNLCEIKGIVVTDVFGQHILIRPANQGSENEWQRWAMFHHADVNDNSFTNTNKFYLVPAITKSLEGSPLEQVNLLRDEMANTVWAVENTVPSQAGIGVSGEEMALRERDEDTFTPVANAPVRYVLGTTVPENWIPFIPVHMEGSDIEIRLQRATMPGAKGALGILLKEKAAPYYINEEQIPRSGIIVKRSFQRTRWLNGKTYLWIGRSKQAGKGEGWSNLKFDQIEDILE